MGSDGADPKLQHLGVQVLQVPTVTQPETDGTAAWSETTMVLVQVRAGGVTGLGYSYIDAGAARVVTDLLAPCVGGASAFAIPAPARAPALGAPRTGAR